MQEYPIRHSHWRSAAMAKHAHGSHGRVQPCSCLVLWRAVLPYMRALLLHVEAANSWRGLAVCRCWQQCALHTSLAAVNATPLQPCQPVVSVGPCWTQAPVMGWPVENASLRMMSLACIAC